MSKIRFIIFFSCIFFFCCSSAWGGRVEWFGYDQGVKKAKSEKKPIFLYFYSDRCGYCQLVENKTFSDRTVANLLQDTYVPIRVNLFGNDRLQIKYSVFSVPCFCFLTPEGEGIAKWTGYMPKTYAKELIKKTNKSSYNKAEFGVFVQQLFATYMYSLSAPKK
jgi:thioredoxin-related protein